ncbi:MAG: NAD-dependent epimerase/dehydratase family protein [Nitrosopumilaceae archaeon]
MKKILITGHTGFLGTHLANKLMKQYYVLGISKNSTRLPIKQIRKDIVKITADEVPNDVYCIIHLAAITDVEYCQNNPAKCFQINAQGTQNMLEIARKINSKFLYLSTSHVYGHPKQLPIPEDHPRNPASIYATSKLVGEIIAESYARSYGMDVSILRLFSVYGIRSPPHLVIAKIIAQLLSNDVIELGNLYPRRDFVYIDDVIASIALVMKKSKGFNVFNVGSGKSYSILEICNMLKRLGGKNIRVKSLKSLSRKNEIKNITSDSTKIKKLGWVPATTIHVGLQKTLQGFIGK